MSLPTVTFTRDDSNEWGVEVDGHYVGTLTRERPRRWAAGARKGTAQVAGAGWLWMFVGRGVPSLDTIPNNADLKAAKRLVAAHLEG